MLAYTRKLASALTSCIHVRSRAAMPVTGTPSASRLTLVFSAVLALALGFGPATALGTTLERLTVEQMATRATTVIEGRVISTVAERTSDGNVRTAVTIAVNEPLKGSTKATQVVYVPGGTLADGTTVVVDGMASFSVGDTSYVFADDDGWVVGGFQGKVDAINGYAGEASDASQTVSERVSEALGTPAASRNSLATVGTATHEVVLSAPKAEAPSSAIMSIASSAIWFTDGFESGRVGTGWDVLDANTWGATDEIASTGTYSAWCIGNNIDYPYANSYMSRMLRGPYDLSASGGAAALSADLWLDSELNHDFAKMLVSTDGINYYGTAYSGEVAAWSAKTLDLTNVYKLGNVSRAPKLYVMLAFTSDATYAPGPGALFDNVSLTGGGTVSTPVVTGISPTSAPAGTNTHVTIDGTGFGPAKGAVEFSYGRDSVMRIGSEHIVSWTDTQIDCVVPTGVVDGYLASAGSGPVFVTNATGVRSEGYDFAVPFGFLSAKWPTPAVTYTVNTAGIDSVRRETLVDAATSTWNAAGSPFRFTDGGLTSGGFVADGFNVISWSDDVPLGVIAQAGSRTQDGRIIENDIQMSNVYSWGDGTSGTMDIQSITEHETGHWLRLADQYMDGDAAKVMYGYGAPNEVKRTLTEGDIAGIMWVYPPSASNGTLAGTVTDSQGAALAGVTVSVPGYLSASTATDGSYAIGDLAARAFDVTFSKDGYASQKHSVTIGSGAMTTKDAVVAVGSSTAIALTTKSNSALSYGGSFAVKGSLKAGSVSLVGGQVILQSHAPGGSYADTTLKATTGAGGAFTFTVKPTSKTYYRVRFAAVPDYVGSGSTSLLYATPKTYVRTPIAASTMSHSKSYTVYGYLKPRHTSGTYPVRIYRYRLVSGHWKSYGYVKAKASNYSTYSKYSAKLKLGIKGRWRLRGYTPSDSNHATTWSSGYDYVTVK